MPDTVFVTGGTGFLGNNVVRRLRAEGYHVRVLTRGSRNPRPLEGLEITRIEGDLSDLPALRAGCDNCVAIVHAAAIVRIGWSLAGGMHETNVEGTARVALAAREAGVRMIHVSTVNCLAVPDNPRHAAHERTPRTGHEIHCNYVQTKRLANERVAEQVALGLDAITVYPGFALGPWDWKPSSGRMLLAVGTRWTPLAPRGGCSVTDGRDVAAAIVRLCSAAPGEREFILAGRNMPYLDLWKAMAKASGGRAPLGTLPPWLERTVGHLGDRWALMRGNESDINSAALRMSAQFHYYDSRRARDCLDYAPRDVDETVNDAWQWLAGERGLL